MKKTQLINRDYLLAKEFHINTKQYEKTSKNYKYGNYVEDYELKKVASKEKIPLIKSDVNENELFKSIIHRKSYDELEIRVPVDKQVLSDLLNYSYGSKPNNYHFINTVPSAGGRYPVSLYLISFNVQNLRKGIYYWDPFEHNLCLIKEGNYRGKLKESIAINKLDIEYCSFAIVLTADIDKSCAKYGNRGYRFVCMDVGFVSQNLYLLSSNLEIGTRAIGGYYDDGIKNLLSEEKEEVMLVHIFGKECITPKEQLKVDLSNYFHLD
ncbi:SagB/ThcOx family dehydrogenase [Heyndrickxia sp. FSL K6-6286]|uniref:SagB/ThcOx family dehydrogenase n=1 Tax=Heyndrickxia sp. FSL K6-6286 TaxID=2921510 RepID=UPI00315A405F